MIGQRTCPARGQLRRLSIATAMSIILGEVRGLVDDADVKV
jgi:hypothetical protein